jgi:hypothetical protein
LGECEIREKAMSSQPHAPAAEDIAALIEKEWRRDINVRFLRGMPAFRTDSDLPEEFRVLLSRLDKAERRARERGT